MINKSGAPRTGDFIELGLVTTAIGYINRGDKDSKHLLMITEDDPHPNLLDAKVIVKVEIFCNSVSIYTRSMPFAKNLSKEVLKKDIVGKFCLTIICDLISSGLINYRMTIDASTEAIMQQKPGNDRISLIKKITKSHPSSKVGIERGWSWWDKAEGAMEGVGDWDFRVLLDESYERLQEGVKLLQEELDGKR